MSLPPLLFFLVNVSFFLAPKHHLPSFQLLTRKSKQLLLHPTAQITNFFFSFPFLPFLGRNMRIEIIFIGSSERAVSLTCSEACFRGSFMWFRFIFNQCFPNSQLFPGNNKKIELVGTIQLWWNCDRYYITVEGKIQKSINFW